MSRHETSVSAGFQLEVTMNRQQRYHIGQWAKAMMGRSDCMTPREASKKLTDFVDGLDYREIAPTVEALGWSAREAKKKLRPRTYYRLFGWGKVREGIEAVCEVADSNHAELALLLRVAKGVVSRWYNGKAAPSPEHRERLETAMASAGRLREGKASVELSGGPATVDEAHATSNLASNTI